MSATKTRLPGDQPADAAVARMVRVDHAGEYGAVRIYQGQLTMLRRHGTAVLLRQMLAQEQRHLDAFAGLIADRRVRPTALLPLWHVAGFTLGAATAALGARAAMACTVAVEEAIDAHYQRQVDQLREIEPGLSDTISRFRDEEREHRDIALTHGAEQVVGFRVLRAAIKAGCRAAIALSERL